jgi:hypothetical protein
MLPIHYFLDDLYNERWGDPRDPAPANPPHASSRTRSAVRLLAVIPFAGLCLRQRQRRPDAWSFTIPIDRRFR